MRIRAGHAGFRRIQGVEQPGVILTEVPGGHGGARLRAAGVTARHLGGEPGEERVFVPLPGTHGPEATLRALCDLLQPPA